MTAPGHAIYVEHNTHPEYNIGYVNDANARVLAPIMEGSAPQFGEYGADYKFVCMLDVEESTHRKGGYRVHYHVVCTSPATLAEPVSGFNEWATNFGTYIRERVADEDDEFPVMVEVFTFA